MRSVRPLLFLFTIVFAAGIPAAAQPTPAAAPATVADRPLRLAVVNPARVFKEMAETKSLSEGLEAKRKQLLGEEMQRRTEIEDLIKQRADTNPNNPTYRELCFKIDSAKSQLQAWGVATKAAVERDQKYMVKNLYDKIEASIAIVAQNNKIDIVLPDNRQDVGNLEEIPADELRRMLAARTPLFASKAADISELVIVELDKKFLAEKK